MTPAPRPSREVAPAYKGGELDAARGPGLGCFYVQVALLAVLVVLTPVSAFAGWSPLLTLGLMVATIVLLLLVGQTVIFLLRIVAAERGRRRPLAGRSRTVGDVEAAEAAEAARPADAAEAAGAAGPASSAPDGPEVTSGTGPADAATGSPEEATGPESRGDESGVRE